MANLQDPFLQLNVLKLEATANIINERDVKRDRET